MKGHRDYKLEVRELWNRPELLPHPPPEGPPQAPPVAVLHEMYHLLDPPIEVRQDEQLPTPRHLGYLPPEVPLDLLPTSSTYPGIPSLGLPTAEGALRGKEEVQEGRPELKYEPFHL